MNPPKGGFGNGADGPIPAIGEMELVAAAPTWGGR